ncbi:hypothetical protein L6164_022851 [Bauhinia variegata]|uniref:Uncharacterized protein n=1 Tax=Bauhinia variegata TaxID=167791 RepID=A0ACB9MGY2_BAUVA|nr:hypothetical protein L6164_022851 [Bauhinia variegata]
MALSSYLNCDVLQALNQEMGIFHHPPHDKSFSQLAPTNLLLPHYSSGESFSLANTFFDNSYIDPFLNPELYLPCPPQSYECELPSIEDCNCNAVNYKQSRFLRCPKRQRSCYDNQYHPQEQYSSLDVAPANFFFDGFSPNPHCSFSSSEELLPELLFPAVPEFKAPALPPAGNCVGNIINDFEKTVSPQSIAARERRRKITEKTQELGKLVPNGNNMNTAEMFSAAAKYVKFLQAQVVVLQLINTLEEEDKEATTPIPSEDLKALLGSTSVQEKLYLEEKCFFPKQLVSSLTKDPQLQSKPSILKDLNQLIANNI